jgi:hypothetical protein
VDTPYFLQNSVDGTTFNASIDFDCIEHFIAYYIKALGSCAKSQLHKIIDFVQGKINRNLVDNGSELQPKVVRQNTIIKSIRKTICSSKATFQNKNQVDLQAELLISVSPDEEIKFINKCYNPCTKNTCDMRALSHMQSGNGLYSSLPNYTVVRATTSLNYKRNYSYFPKGKIIVHNGFEKGVNSI